MSGDFHGLRVLETRAETDQATSVIFDVPVALQATFCWRAGQHLTVRFDIGGEEVRRSYSISQTPVTGEPLRITVKRVKNGVVSNHINQGVKAGDTIEVMPPFGGFCLDPDESARRTHYFFGAGSGITPLFAMIRSVLEAEPHSVAYLAYGNVSADTIIFRDRLAELEQEAGGRLTVRHVLSKLSYWSSFEYWRRGIIDVEAVKAFIDDHQPYAQDAQYYICGPGTMNGAVKSALMNLDVPVQRIHVESYGGAVERDTSFEGVASVARVSLNGETMSIAVAPGQTVLDAVRVAGGTPRYSCQSGVCGACRARLDGGAVHLRARMALTDDEIANGAILTCQALAKTPELAISYN